MRLPCWLIGHSLGPVNEQRYQICGFFGKAKVALCPHDWEILSTYEHEHRQLDGRTNKVGLIYSIRCKRCVEIEQRKVGILS